MTRSTRAPQAGRPPATTAFLLTQLGTHAAGRFADLVAELDLTPPECGILGILGGRPGMSQQELADLLGMIPSRVVPLVDKLEGAGLVKRVRDTVDRRRNALELTSAGRAQLIMVGRVGKQHDDEFTAALDEKERTQLRDLLKRIADHRGLTPGVHPGYRTLDPAGGPAKRRRNPA